jgi:hypothetical protein
MNSTSVDDLLRQATQPAQAKPIGISGTELMATDFPDPPWLVDGLLPLGFTILAGPPKKGKSWFALELALSICMDGSFLGRKTTAGKVLYVAFEDGPTRMKNRMKRQGWPQRATDNITIVFGREFHENFGGKDGIEKFIAYIKTGGYVLVVIDTVARAFHVKDWNDASAVIPVLGPLQELAIEDSISVLACDHHNKLRSLDLVLDLAGTVAKSGVADTLIGLYREQGKPGARLVVTGRDVEDVAFDIEFDALSGCWQPVDPSPKITQQQQEVLDALQELGGESTLSDLAKAIGCDKANLYRRLISLSQDGLVTKGRGVWKLI